MFRETETRRFAGVKTTPASSGILRHAAILPEAAEAEEPIAAGSTGGLVLQRQAATTGPGYELAEAKRGMAPVEPTMPGAPPTAPYVMYIGGAADDLLTHIVESYATSRGARFLGWSNYGQAAKELKSASTVPDRPVVVVGHSLGGATALAAAANSGVMIDLVITIDPVGPVFSFDRSKMAYWINVLADPPTSDRSDKIAALGGKVGLDITGQADFFHTSAAHHGYFDTMMQEISAVSRIATAEKGPRAEPAPEDEGSDE